MNKLTINMSMPEDSEIEKYMNLDQLITKNMKVPQALRVFEISIVPSTEFKPPRIKVYDCFNRESIRLSAFHNFASNRDAVINHLNSLGIEVSNQAGNGDKFFLMTNDFDIKIK